MGIVVPDDFVLSSLNGAERRVVEALRDGLTDGWVVLPHVGLNLGGRDFELDVVVVHEGYGVAVIEVKGHRVEVVDGVWRSRGVPLDPQPTDQARNNAYALRSLLRDRCPGLERVHVESAVAFPNVTAIAGTLPPDVLPEQVLTRDDLDDLASVVPDLLLTRTRNQPLAAEQVEAIVGVLRPDVSFAWDPSARRRYARERLDELCADQTRALERLDVNRRVVVTGPVGTGKTRLATAWAGRALVRGERVLLTCYNEPLADTMRAQWDDGEPDPDLVVGPFLRLALGLPGMPAVEVPDDADHEWWTVTAVGHLLSNWHRVTARFDTVVVDEAQDFSPAWLALLESLLDPDGERRFLMVADPRQDLYTRGFRLPPPDDGWVRAELVTNCRNAHGIGAILRRYLGGPPSPVVGPEALGIGWVPVGSADDLAGAVRGVLDGVDGEVAVLTVTGRVRDRLVADVGLVRWEHRADGVLCENVHRVKGLEFDTVVLAVDDPGVTDDLLAAGISRAVSGLTVVAPEPVARRLGLASGG